VSRRDRFEAFINHVHVEEVLSLRTGDPAVLEQAGRYVAGLSGLLEHERPDAGFVIILTVGDSCTCGFTSCGQARRGSAPTSRPTSTRRSWPSRCPAGDVVPGTARGENVVQLPGSSIRSGLAVSDGVRLQVRMIPNSRRDEVVGRYGDGRKNRLRAAPDRRKANEQVVRLLNEP
jgi:hypothetical protein